MTRRPLATLELREPQTNCDGFIIARDSGSFKDLEIFTQRPTNCSGQLLICCYNRRAKRGDVKFRLIARAHRQKSARAVSRCLPWLTSSVLNSKTGEIGRASCRE